MDKKNTNISEYDYVIGVYDEYEKKLDEIYNSIVNDLNYTFCDLTGHLLDENNLKCVKNWVKQFGAKEVFISINISFEQYFDGNSKSIDRVIEYIPKICQVRKYSYDGNIFGTINYLVKIAKNNYRYVNEKELKKILRENMSFEDSPKIKDVVIKSKNWTELKSRLSEYFNIEI